MPIESVPLAAFLAVLMILLAILVQVLSALLERSGPIRLRHWAEEAGGRLRALHETPLRLEVYRLLLGWLARLAPAVLFLAVWLVLRGLVSSSLLWAFVTVAVVSGITELMTRLLVGRDPEGSLRLLTGFYRFMLVVLTPLLLALAPLYPASGVERQEDEDGVTDDEIEAYISVGTQEGILEPGEEELILGVLDFGDTLVKSVVTPRIDMVCAPVDSDLDALAELFLSSKHSRIPVYRETVDQIVGILHIRDLLRGLRSRDEVSVLDLAVEPYFVPESKAVSELLSEFQAQRQQVAIVVDEYGGTSGMVTVEDLLEEIVGEIEDEHDDAAPRSEALPDGRWRVDGRLPLETLDELFNVDVDEEPYETVGGLIFGLTGLVPSPGEVVQAHGLILEVEEVEERRITSVLVGKLQEDTSEDTQ